MKIIYNCIRHRMWKEAWRTIKFNWRWRKYKAPFGVCIKCAGIILETGRHKSGRCMPPL